MVELKSKTLWNTEASEWSELPSISEASSETFDSVLADYFRCASSDESVNEKVKPFETSVTEEVLKYVVR